MVLREILDSKLSSVFFVSFLFHKNASTQGNVIECVSNFFHPHTSTFAMTPRLKQENDDEGQVWRKEILNNNGWFMAYRESYLGHTFEGPHFSTLLILELINFSHPLFCFSFAMQLRTPRWQAEWCTSEQWFFLCCMKELSTVSMASVVTAIRDTPHWLFLSLPLVLFILSSSTSSFMTIIHVSFVWPIELEVFLPSVLIWGGLRVFLHPQEYVITWEDGLFPKRILLEDMLIFSDIPIACTGLIHLPALTLRFCCCKSSTRSELDRTWQLSSCSLTIYALSTDPTRCSLKNIFSMLSLWAAIWASLQNTVWKL